MCAVTEQASTDARPHNDAAERWPQACVQYKFDGIAVRCTHRSPDPDSIQGDSQLQEHVALQRGNEGWRPIPSWRMLQSLVRNSTGAGTQKAPQPKRLAVLPFTNRDGGI